MRRRSSALGVFLGLVASLAVTSAADAQQASAKRVATAETLPATAPAVAPLPQPQDAIGIAIQQKLSAATKGRSEDADAQDRAALAGFYASRVYAPVWVSASGLNAKAAAVIAEFGKANDWGLEAADFPVPAIATPAGGAPSPDVIADAELTLSLAALKYARYARGGRIIDPATQLSSYLDRKPQLLEPKSVIEQIAAAGEADAYLRGLHPQHPQFEKLRQKMLAMRTAAAATAVESLPNGPQLVPGRSDPQVAILRRRLKAALPPATAEKPADENFYDDTLKAAVMAFQTESGTRPDGIVGNATRALLNDVEVLSPAKLLANMEEWRWMPADLGQLYVNGQHPRVHAAHRQGRGRDPHRARHHRPRRQADAGVLRGHEDDRVPAALERAQLDQGDGAVAEPRPRRHLVRPPGPAPVAQRPRHRSGKRRLELVRHPQL